MLVEKRVEICVGTDRSKAFIARLSLLLIIDGQIANEYYHRIPIQPGDDLSVIRAANENNLLDPNSGIPFGPWPKIPDEEWQEVEQLVGIVHKPSVVAAYKERIEAMQKEFDKKTPSLPK
jgi:hypothetical protein